MKKSLLALSILGAFSGSALAQSSVTIYGVADAGINRYDSGAATNATSTRIDSGVGNSSRLGFKGTEDLGGGNSAIFTLENGYSIDTGAQSGALFGRQAFVGMSGNWGAVKLGRQYNPIRTVLESVDPFALGLAGNAENNFIREVGTRSDNSITYSTPNVSGFSGQIAYSAGEVAGDSSRARQYGASAAYVNGPINVVLAHHNRKFEAAGVAAGDAKTTLLGGTYDFNVVKAHAAFALNKGDTATGLENLDSRDMMVAVSAPVGPGTVLAGYTFKNDRRAADADAKTFAIAYMYALSKRTHLYTSYGKTKNDVGSNVGFYGLPVAAATGDDPSVFNVGVRHKF